MVVISGPAITDSEQAIPRPTPIWVQIEPDTSAIGPGEVTGFQLDSTPDVLDNGVDLTFESYGEEYQSRLFQIPESLSCLSRHKF